MQMQIWFAIIELLKSCLQVVYVEKLEQPRMQGDS